jgi:putative addiction module component (TIGR02574 family)
MGEGLVTRPVGNRTIRRGGVGEWNAVIREVITPKIRVFGGQRHDEGMARDASEVVKDALSLPIEVRSALIDSLIDSLDEGDDAAAEEAWCEETRRRLHQIDSGAVQLLPWDEARARLRSRSSR